MSANELRDWLKEEQSQSSGWQNESGSGETIGHERLVAAFPHTVHGIQPSTDDFINNQRSQNRLYSRAQSVQGAV